jgi:hypothetical protein
MEVNGDVSIEQSEQLLDLPDCLDTSSDVKSSWHLLGYSTPKSQIIFFAQIIVIYIVIAVSLINLSIGNGDSNLWSALLCSCLGYLLPSPTIKHKDNVLSGPTKQ